jgi:hypothetical protein
MTAWWVEEGGAGKVLGSYRLQPGIHHKFNSINTSELALLRRNSLLAQNSSFCPRNRTFRAKPPQGLKPVITFRHLRHATQRVPRSCPVTKRISGQSQKNASQDIFRSRRAQSLFRPPCACSPFSGFGRYTFRATAHPNHQKVKLPTTQKAAHRLRMGSGAGQKEDIPETFRNLCCLM